jgi:uncharacterized membrane protein
MDHGQASEKTNKPVGFRRVYSAVGFSKAYNFVLWLIFLGAWLGFALARLEYLDFYGKFCSPGSGNGTGHAGPGECFYYSQDLYKIGIILHLGTILPAALLVCVQFIPIVRRRTLIVHRVNGYVVITLSIISIAGVFMIAGRSFGGRFETQTAIGLLAIGFVVALLLAIINIKRLQIEQHRAWMLRAWVWVSLCPAPLTSNSPHLRTNTTC